MERGLTAAASAPRAAEATPFGHTSRDAGDELDGPDESDEPPSDATPREAVDTFEPSTIVWLAQVCANFQRAIVTTSGCATLDGDVCLKGRRTKPTAAPTSGDLRSCDGVTARLRAAMGAPFKAIDELSRHPRRASRVEAGALLPRDVFALVKLFPSSAAATSSPKRRRASCRIPMNYAADGSTPSAETFTVTPHRLPEGRALRPSRLRHGGWDERSGIGYAVTVVDIELVFETIGVVKRTE
jgi:hypothetical protein